MRYKRVLITGGAGFVGSNLAIELKGRFADMQLVAFDSLKRRGSELNVARLKAQGVQFVHGDIRCPEDISSCGSFDLLIDCSAEPSVHAGMHGSPLAVINTNLVGTINCAEAARINKAALLYLSTSRVYPIEALNAIEWEDAQTRFKWRSKNDIAGFSEHGISEEFSLDGVRSFYGATKLASELILQEYAFAYGMPVLIDRCGIIAGPWQMGKVDQGVVTLWAVSHLFERKLDYIGFNGSGKQVRDMLHVKDLFELVGRQLEKPELWDGRIYNIGGGYDVSASLLELTEYCRAATGNKIPIGCIEKTADVDIRIYITDARRAQKDFGWQPERGVERIVEEITAWAKSNRSSLQAVLLS